MSAGEDAADDATEEAGEAEGEAGARATPDRDAAVAWFLAELARAADTPDEDLVGERVGCFALVRTLHAGTLGTMYEARDESSGERVAVRVVTETVLPDGERREQLKAAADNAVGLSHANLASLRAVIEDGERLAIVSDLVEGLRLQERLSRVNQLSLQEAQTVARGVARALAAAHDADVLHLDVTPGNVVMSHTGVKLLDVGLGMAGGSPLRGSPRYASPEQTRDEPCDARSDVFSFGVLVYELLSGRSPFDADDMEQAVERVRSEDPPPLSELREEVPESLAALVDRCLQKAPEDRFADGAALVAALEEIAPAPITRPPTEASAEPEPAEALEPREDEVAASPPELARAEPDALDAVAMPRPWLEIGAALVVVAVILYLALNR